MKTKLDENLGERGIHILRSAGWDVETVMGEGLCSSPDSTIIETCRVEERILISLDKDFSDTTRFPPGRYYGVVVLRLPEPLSLEAIDNALTRMLFLAATRSPAGRLWIIDRKRIREFAEEDES